MSDGQLAVHLPWQAGQWQSLIELHEEQRLPHAVLISGPPGIGKRRFAEAFAQYLMCETPRQGVACGECRQCRFMLGELHPDLKWVSLEDKARQIKIDQVRELVDALSQTSQQGGYKVAVLTPAEAMNVNAANALLKCLEEPAPRTVLLLVSDVVGQILPTIRSRCQLVKFPLPEKQQVCEWMGGMISDPVLVEQLLSEAAGQPLTALALRDNGGLEWREQLQSELQAMLEQRQSPLAVAQSWMGHELSDVLGWLAQKIERLIKLRMAVGAEVVAEEDRKLLIRLQANDNKVLFTLLDELLGLRTSLGRGGNPNPQLALESVLLNICEIFNGR